MYHRMRQFYDVIRSNPNLTELEIATRVGLKKTPYSHRILMDLIAENYIARNQDANADKLTYLYFVQETEPMKLESQS
jgi:predicted transcriptional regulator